MVSVVIHSRSGFNTFTDSFYEGMRVMHTTNTDSLETIVNRLADETPMVVVFSTDYIEESSIPALVRSNVIYYGSRFIPRIELYAYLRAVKVPVPAADTRQHDLYTRSLHLGSNLMGTPVHAEHSYGCDKFNCLRTEFFSKRPTLVYREDVPGDRVSVPAVFGSAIVPTRIRMFNECAGYVSAKLAEAYYCGLVNVFMVESDGWPVVLSVDAAVSPSVCDTTALLNRVLKKAHTIWSDDDTRSYFERSN